MDVCRVEAPPVEVIIAPAWLVAMCDAMTDAVLVRDATGRVILANAPFRRLFHQDDLAPGSRAPDLTSRLQRLPAPPPHLSALAASTTQEEPCERVRLLAPTPRIFERREVALADPNGQSVGWATILRDVTQEHDEAARQAEFLAHVAHELKTPLTCIRGHAQLLGRQIEQAERSGQVGPGWPGARTPAREATEAVQSAASWRRPAERLHAMGRQVARLEHLLLDLLDAETLDADALPAPLEVANIARLARRAVDDASARARQQRITLSAPDILPVRCDARRIERVLYNMVASALESTPAGTTLRLTLKLAYRPVGSRRTIGVLITVGPATANAHRHGTPADGESQQDTTPSPVRAATWRVGVAIARRHGGTLRTRAVCATNEERTITELWLPVDGPQTTVRSPAR